jgi:phosphate transport system substrate-binding protein
MRATFMRWALFVLALASLTAPAFAATELVGAGSSFDFPFFSKAFFEYGQKHSDVSINYQSIGSGGGIQQFTARTVDFGATDVPMNTKELAAAQVDGRVVLQVPVTLGGVAMAYNVPGVSETLKMTRGLIADIYLGKITKWNDPALQRLNPSVKLPDMPIVTVHRSDGSGTTYIFTDFLGRVSAEWKTKVGTDKSVDWPAPNAVGGKGNEGVAGAVRQTPGSIGYLELAYVLENAITYATVENKAGRYVLPTIDSVRAAAAAKPSVSATDFSIVDQATPEAYPISGYSWVVLYQKPTDTARARMLKAIMSWLVTDGQALAQTVKYVPLPPNVQKTAILTIERMQV